MVEEVQARGLAECVDRAKIEIKGDCVCPINVTTDWLSDMVTPLVSWLLAVALIDLEQKSSAENLLS